MIPGGVCLRTTDPPAIVGAVGVSGRKPNEDQELAEFGSQIFDQALSEVG